MERPKSMSQRFKYWNDDRSQNQKTITNKVVEILSQRNLQRVSQSKLTPPQTDILFLTINGVPPREKEFDPYIFPGKVINFKPLRFPDTFSETTMNEEEIMAYLNTISMQSTIQQINKIVQANGNKVILVCHSYGCFISAMYCSKYPQKIVGYIGLGGPSIRFYQVLKDYTNALLSVPDITRQFLVENYSLVYQLYDKDMSKKHKTMDRFHNKFQLISWVLHNQEYILNQIFDSVRNLPPVLILSVYGSRDTVYGYDLCCEYAAYMSFLKKNKMTPEYCCRVWQNLSISDSKLTLQNKQIPQSPQQHFIYLLEGVSHGVHYTPNQISKIQSIIDDYLYILLTSLQQPKSHL